MLPKACEWPPGEAELRELYWEKNLPLSKIGHLYNRRPSQILQVMKAYSIRRRTISESMTRFPKAPFSGNDEEKAYLLGLRAGDLYVAAHGRCLRATVSSTHPSMIELMNQLFGRYGRVVRRPKLIRKWQLFEWESYVYLDSSFEFMHRKPDELTEPFLDFFAGFFDVEGCIVIKRQNKSKSTNCSLELANNNLPLLRLCGDRLRSLGYHATIPPRPYHTKGEFVGLGRYNRDCWRLGISRKAEVIALLSSLNLVLKERVDKRALALTNYNRLWQD